MQNLVAEIKKLTSSFAKLESESEISKNVTTVFVRKTGASGKTMLGQC